MKTKLKDGLSAPNKDEMLATTVGELRERVEGTNAFALIIIPGSPPAAVIVADGEAASGILNMLAAHGHVSADEIMKTLNDAAKIAQA